jgi:hypothetical protein
VPSFFNELSPNVIAALTGAGATLIAALINLRIAWRREVLDRVQRARVNPRARRGLLIAITILVVAAGVGGYAGAMYVMQRSQQSTEAMRAELQQQIAQIKETAARFEQTRIGERASIEIEARLLDERRRGREGTVAGAVIAPCAVRQGTGDASEPAICAESDAPQVGVCAAIPATASVYEVVPFARYEGEEAEWIERRLALGGRFGALRVGAQFAERPDAGTNKRICVDFWSWDSQRALEARLVVRYLPADNADALRPAVVAPVQATATVKR